MSNAEGDAGAAEQMTATEIVASELELGIDLNDDGVIGASVLLSTPTP